MKIKKVPHIIAGLFFIKSLGFKTLDVNLIKKGLAKLSPFFIIPHHKKINN